MADERDIPTLTLTIMRDMRDEMRGMREELRGMLEEQRQTNARLDHHTEILQHQTRVLDTHTDQLEVHGRGILMVIEEARVTNERFLNFVSGVHKKDHDDLRSRVQKLEAQVFRTRKH